MPSLDMHPFMLKHMHYTQESACTTKARSMLYDMLKGTCKKNITSLHCELCEVQCKNDIVYCKTSRKGYNRKMICKLTFEGKHMLLFFVRILLVMLTKQFATLKGWKQKM